LWNNQNDLGLALHLPNGGVVDFSNKSLIQQDGTEIRLDIDMNAGTTQPDFNNKRPIENIYLDQFFVDGEWCISVHYFRHRWLAPLNCQYEIVLQIGDATSLYNGTIAGARRAIVVKLQVVAGGVVAAVAIELEEVYGSI